MSKMSALRIIDHFWFCWKVGKFSDLTKTGLLESANLKCVSWLKGIRRSENNWIITKKYEIIMVTFVGKI